MTETNLYDQAIAAFRAGDNERTRELSEQLRASGAEVDGLCMLARVALREGDAARVQELATEARRAAADEESERMPLHLQAAGARIAGDLEAARRLYLESIELNRRLGHDFVAAELHNLGYIELHDGNVERAKQLFAESLTLARERGLDGLLPYLVIDRGVVAREEGDLELAVRTLAAATADFERRVEEIDPDDRAEVDLALAKARTVLEPDRFEALWAEGRELSIEKALT